MRCLGALAEDRDVDVETIVARRPEKRFMDSDNIDLSESIYMWLDCTILGKHSRNIQPHTITHNLQVCVVPLKCRGNGSYILSRNFNLFDTLPPPFKLFDHCLPHNGHMLIEIVPLLTKSMTPLYPYTAIFHDPPPSLISTTSKNPVILET